MKYMFCMLNAQTFHLFMEVWELLIFYPMYFYGAIINFPIICVQLSVIVFPSYHIGKIQKN